MDKFKLFKMLALVGAVILFAVLCSKAVSQNSMSLAEYAKNQPSPSPEPDPTQTPGTDREVSDDSEDASSDAVPDRDGGRTESPGTETAAPSDDRRRPVGALLNGDSQLAERNTLEEGFYAEPLSQELRRYITGISYPADPPEGEKPLISLDELQYVHILHYDFNGQPQEGELICHREIAGDLLEIFYQLYQNEYQLERVCLIDAYNGDDEASMEDNNTSCFNYRTTAGSDSLSRHALGLAVDINPFYNPYLTYNEDGSVNISPAGAEDYADRSALFPYKIDEDDLCCKLFLRHGFTWGGNWNSCKDYQHFQKSLD